MSRKKSSGIDKIEIRNGDLLINDRRADDKQTTSYRWRIQLEAASVYRAVLSLIADGALFCQPGSSNTLTMTYLTLHVNDNAVIEIENSLMGKESILYNGEVMSEFSSVLGGTPVLQSLPQDSSAKSSDLAGAGCNLQIADWPQHTT